MTRSRDLVYSFVNSMAKHAMQNPCGLDYRDYQSVVPGSGCYEDFELQGMLNQVEDDRMHVEAEKIRKLAAESKIKESVGLWIAANMLDPYQVVDGQLVRKSDGRPVNL